jgi:hypothetical protein
MADTAQFLGDIYGLVLRRYLTNICERCAEVIE